MSRILLFLTVLLILFITGCSSSDEGLKVTKEVHAEYNSASFFMKDNKEFTKFVYLLRSSSAEKLVGYLELTTVDAKSNKSEAFYLNPRGVIKVEVLIEGRYSAKRDIREAKVYSNIVVDPKLPDFIGRN